MLYDLNRNTLIVVGSMESKVFDEYSFIQSQGMGTPLGASSTR